MDKTFFEKERSRIRRILVGFSSDQERIDAIMTHAHACTYDNCIHDKYPKVEDKHKEYIGLSNV